MASKLDHAQALIAKGFKVFPIEPLAKAPPLMNDWPNRAWTTVNAWPGEANIGIHCEGLLVIDVDVKKGGKSAFELLQLIEDLPATLVTNTPSGGFHVFYRLPDGHRGVPNSVSVLGSGLDIRSTGGYVVAPGSVVPAGAYTFADAAAEIAPAPDWLVQRLGVVRDRSGTEDHNERSIPDASDDVVARATAWLQSAERSVKGAGGDQAAYRVACALRDQGVSYAQACDLMRSEAWDYGCGWRDGWLEQKPIRSAYKYAQNEPGAKAIDAKAFTASPAAMPLPVVKPKETKVQLATEMAGEAAVYNYVIKHWLTAASYVDLFGAPGEGKTFNALDMAYHVATSKPWMGNRVHGGLVLYLAFEGKGGMRKRVRALAQRDKDLGKLYVANAAMNLRETAGRNELGAVLAELPEKPVLIVIDTFARALMGGDENSAQDVGAFNNAIEALIESTGACVMIIHHSGKNKSAGARGSSALLGAIDTEIEVDNKQIISRKQRDGENPMPIGFMLKPVSIGMDSDNELMTSCVVEQSAVSLLSKPLVGKAAHAFSILSELTGEENRPVSRSQWVTKMQDEGFARTTSHEWVRKLERMGKVTVEGNTVTRRMT